MKIVLGAIAVIVLSGAWGAVMGLFLPTPINMISAIIGGLVIGLAGSKVVNRI